MVKEVQGLTGPTLAAALMGRNPWRQRQTSMGPCCRERPFVPTTWAGQWTAPPWRVGDRPGVAGHALGVRGRAPA
jgi:hypothetical protein